jgi:hypothetical protein
MRALHAKRRKSTKLPNTMVSAYRTLDKQIFYEEFRVANVYHAKTRGDLSFFLCRSLPLLA